MQDVLGSNSLAPDPALGKRHVLGQVLVQVMADHQHVEVFVDRISGEGPGGIGRTGQDVLLATDGENIGCVTASGSFGVVGMDGASGESGDRGFDESGFVERIGVDADLDVVVFGDPQAAVDGRGRGAPVLVELESHGPSDDLFGESFGLGRVALTEEPEVQRQVIGGLQHHGDVGGSGRAGGGTGPGGRARAASKHRRHSAGDRFVGLLRADEVDVRVDASGGQDLAFPGDHFGCDSHDHLRVDPGHHVGVTGLADACDPPVLDPDVGLVDAREIDDQRVGDQQVQGVVLRDTRGLAHAVPQHLAASELAFVSVDRVVVFDLEHQAGVTQPQPVAGGRSVDFGIGGSLDFVGHAVCLPSVGVD